MGDQLNYASVRKRLCNTSQKAKNSRKEFTKYFVSPEGQVSMEIKLLLMKNN